MSTRVQVILDKKEREAFRRLARREGVSLSAWLRQAGRDRLAAVEGSRKMGTVEELRRFFSQCDRLEEGIEPEWEQHKGVIERSARAGGSET